MSLAITFLLHADDDKIIEALSSLLPSKGRPAFSEDVKPGWKRIFQLVELLFPPDKLVREKNYLWLEWFEAPYSLLSLKKNLEKMGASIVFMHTAEDPLIEDASSGEDSRLGYFYLQTEGEMQRLTADNMSDLLPLSNLKWLDDTDKNIEQIICYLIAN